MTDLLDALRGLPATLDQQAPADLADTVRRRARRGAARRRVATAVLAAACVAVAGTVVPALLDRPDRAVPAAPSPRAAPEQGMRELGFDAQLEQLARWSAAAVADPQLQLGRYAYVSAGTLWTDSGGTVREEETETWLASDGTGRRRSTPVGSVQSNDDRGAIFGVTALLRTVPADRDELRRQMRELAGQGNASLPDYADDGDVLFSLAAELVSAPPPSAAWRHAVIAAVVDLEGVRVVDRVPVSDGSGRTGVALVRQRDTGPGEERIVLERDSGALLGTVSVEPDGTVSQRFTPHVTGFTSSLDARP